MKYIKTFENVSVDDLKLIDILTDFLEKFLNEKIDYDFLIRKRSNDNEFWYDKNKNLRSHIFSLIRIDHYYDDTDWFFEFHLDSAITKLEKYIPNDLLLLVLFIKEIMDRYSNFQNCINILSIPKIMKNITEDYDLYIKTTKYNL